GSSSGGPYEPAVLASPVLQPHPRLRLRRGRRGPASSGGAPPGAPYPVPGDDLRRPRRRGGGARFFRERERARRPARKHRVADEGPRERVVWLADPARIRNREREARR